ncbi:hypothetical protein [Lacunimicrobium album]
MININVETLFEIRDKMKAIEERLAKIEENKDEKPKGRIGFQNEEKE